MKVLAAAAALLAVCMAPAQALPMVEGFAVPEITGWDSKVPTPEEVLGHAPAARHTRAEEITLYIREAAKATNRFKVIRHGRSTGGRELVHALISSPENLKKFDQREPGDDRPLVIWMGYGVHGNEASASEAALVMAHALAAGKGPWMDKLLKECIIVLIPCINPDGRDRFVNWVNGNRGGNPTIESGDREHNEPWPGGRSSHYLYDLNRDWLPLTQVESQTRHEVWRRWHPHVTLDFHEQGGLNYFFQPGVPTRVHPLTPKRNQEITLAFARYHARALESFGQTYFTEERYDDFYPGKGSTYPDLCGSIGILFEQASSRSLRIPGLTYATSVRNQVATSFSSLRASLDKSAEIKAFQRDFYANRPKPKWAAIKFRMAQNREGGRLLASILHRHRIQMKMKRVGAEIDVLIPMDQRDSRLIQAIFDRQMEFEDDEFYDISAWSFDLAVGAPAEFLTSMPDAAGWESMSDPSAVWPMVKVQGLPDAYAYLLPWSSDASPKLLRRFLESDMEVKVFRTAMKLDGVGTAQPGDIMVRPKTQEQKDLVVMAYSESIQGGRPLQPIQPTAEGIYSLGGSRLTSLTLPKILIVTGAGSESTNVGEIWQLLDQHQGFAVSLVDSDRLTPAVLDRHTTVILAGGSYAALSERLATWVRGGGRLIALGAAANWVSESGLWKLDATRHVPVTKGLKYGELAGERGRHSLPGTLFEATLDETHPLSWGAPKSFAAFRDSAVFLRPAPEAGANVAVYTDSPLLAGYASPEVGRLAPGALAVAAKREGSGSIVLIPDNVHFRGFFIAMNRVFLNAVYFGGVF